MSESSGKRRLCGCWGTCDHGVYCHCVACELEPTRLAICHNRRPHEPHPYHPFDGDHGITVECSGKMPPLPPPNKLLWATVDDEPAVPLV